MDLRCENSATKGSGIIFPQCNGNLVERHVRIEYNEVERDHLNLCIACTKAVREDAEGHGYRIFIQKKGK